MADTHTPQQTSRQPASSDQKQARSNVDLMLEALKNAHRELSWLNLELHLVTETRGNEAELFQLLTSLKNDSESLLNQMQSLAVALKATAQKGEGILIRPPGRIVHCPDLPPHLQAMLDRVRAEMLS